MAVFILSDPPVTKKIEKGARWEAIRCIVLRLRVPKWNYRVS